MRIAPFLLGVCLLTGCILPSPHRTKRSAEISGKVLDERTHAPIEGAKIFLSQFPRVSCRSRSDGSYLLKASYNWHFGRLIAPPESFDFPEGQSWDDRITVSHINYTTREFNPVPRPWVDFNGSGRILQDGGGVKYLKPGDIHVGEQGTEEVEKRPSKLRIGFTQRVYEPQITPVNNFDKSRLYPHKREGLDWEFRIHYWDWSNEAINDPKNSSRVYRLEFVP
jgi:hypothetical protein